MTEALVLALAGGAAGLPITVGLLRVIVANSPPDVPQFAAVQLDGTVLTFTLVASCVAALVFGAAPAIRAGRVAVGWTARVTDSYRILYIEQVSDLKPVVFRGSALDDLRAFPRSARRRPAIRSIRFNVVGIRMTGSR